MDGQVLRKLFERWSETPEAPGLSHGLASALKMVSAISESKSNMHKSHLQYTFQNCQENSLFIYFLVNQSIFSKLISEFVIEEVLNAYLPLSIVTMFICLWKTKSIQNKNLYFLKILFK